MNRKRILGIVIPVAVALVYFYFNPLAPRVFDSQKNIQSQKQEEQTMLTEQINSQNLPNILTQQHIDNFCKNFAQIRNQMANYKLAETQNPTYQEIASYCQKNGTLTKINETLNDLGLTGDEPLKIFITITNAYGIVSYDTLLQTKQNQARVIKRMAEESTNQLRNITAQEDINLVEDNYELIDQTFKTNVPQKR